MIIGEELLCRRLVDSLRHTLDMAQRDEQPPVRRAIRRIATSVRDGKLGTAIRDLDRLWRCHPDRSYILAPLYGRLLCMGSQDHYATLRLLQHASIARPDPDVTALIAISYLRLGRLDDAHSRLRRALSDFCTDQGSLLNAIAGIIVNHEDAFHGWVGRGSKLEYLGELSGKATARRVEIRGGAAIRHADVRTSKGGRLVFSFRPRHLEDGDNCDVLCDEIPLLGSGSPLRRDFSLDGRMGSTDGELVGWARIGWRPQIPVRVRAEDELGRRREGNTASRSGLRGEWAVRFNIRALGLAGHRFQMLARLPDGRWQPFADSPVLLEPAVRLRGHGRRMPLWGSSDARLSSDSAKAPDSRHIAIVIPVYQGREESLACIRSALATIDETTQVVVVDDATADRQLAADLDALADERRIILLRNPANVGFVTSVNRAAQAHPDLDLVLLNSDTIVFGDWLSRLRAAAYDGLRIGTATPLSNNGSIASYPRAAGAAISSADGAGLHALASSIHAGRRVAIPVGVGFCLFVRRDCLNSVGALDVETFGYGYGEETDFCLRARRLGWSHVLAADVFVYHAGGSSFGGRRAALLDRSQRIINLRHPGYDAFVASFLSQDPLQSVRRRLDEERLLRLNSKFVLITTLALTGGVERFVAERRAELRHQGFVPLLLRPSSQGSSDRCELWTDEIEVPNLVYDTPGDLEALRTLLRGLAISSIEIQHFLDLDSRVIEMVRRLGIPYDVYVHDYTWICPRVTLIDGSNQYCGEPAVRQCQQCVRKHGATLTAPKSVSYLRARSHRWIRAAAKVIAPSNDTARRLLRYFPGVAIQVRPHAGRIPVLALPPRVRGSKRRIAIIGAIGHHKGYRVLLDCARDAKARRLPMELVVIGHTEDDAPLLATGKVYITGRYDEKEAAHLIAREAPDLAWFPSVWPETWCYALDYAIGAGVPVAAFDIGAIAERLRLAGGGTLLPLNLSASQINDTLLSMGEIPSGVAGAKLSAGSVRPARPRSTVRGTRAAARAIKRAEMIDKSYVESAPGTENGLGASVQILPLPAGLYLFSVKAATPFRATTAGYMTLPAVHVGLGPGARPDQVEFVAGPTTQGSWLFSVGDQMVAKVRGDDVSLVLTSVRAPGGEILSIAVERLDTRATAPAAATERNPAVPRPAVAPPVPAGGPLPASQSASPQKAGGLPLQVVVHVRSRGDMTFTNGSWAGRVAPGLWIESFSLRPLEHFGATDIEYKGLTGSGFETPWTSEELMCGTKGMSVPLVGFAIRLKPLQSGQPAEYDCEYSGYFKSGLTVGPLRNGAPCRSTVANDPLEGIQIRLVRRVASGALSAPSLKPSRKLRKSRNGAGPDPNTAGKVRRSRLARRLPGR